MLPLSDNVKTLAVVHAHERGENQLIRQFRPARPPFASIDNPISKCFVGAFEELFAVIHQNRLGE
jgi:hypothetical protein